MTVMSCRRHKSGMVVRTNYRFPEGSSMAIHVQAVPLPGEPEAPSPLNPEGEPYLYCMYFNGDTLAAFSDSATELCGLLIEGYLDIPEADLAEQAIQRTLFAVGAQVRAQANIMAEADYDLATPEELEVLLGSRDTPPEVEVWTCPIPLVLVEAFYAPFAGRPRPIGQPRGGGANDSNIIWLPFSDELEFLTGLHEVGEIQLATYDSVSS